jgi:hypothetical protein
MSKSRSVKRPSKKSKAQAESFARNRFQKSKAPPKTGKGVLRVISPEHHQIGKTFGRPS